MSSKHVIVGGSGAVGAVYASALMRAGHEVALYLKQSYATQFKQQAEREGSTRMKLFDLRTRLYRYWINLGLLFLGSWILCARGMLPIFGMSCCSTPMSVKFGIALVTYVVLVRMLRPLLLSRRGQTIEVKGFDVMSSVEEVAAYKPDYLWLCISMSQLRSEAGVHLIRQLSRVIPSTCMIVNMSPGMNDRQFLEETLGTEFRHRLAHGTISMLSWQAPLQGEDASPTHSEAERAKAQRDGPAAGMRYGDSIAFLALPSSNFWVDSPAPLPRRNLKVLVDALNAGNIPAKMLDSDPKMKTLIGVAASHPILAAMDLSGWTFEGLRTGGRLEIAVEAAKEAVRATCTTFGQPIPKRLLVFTPHLIRLQLWMNLGRWLLPFDIERFLAWHFSKVSDQTLMFMQQCEEMANKLGLPADNLKILIEEYGKKQDTQKKIEKNLESKSKVAKMM